MGRRVIDLSGKEFGQLRPLRPAGHTKTGGTVWLCDCACGAQTMVPSYRLRNGSTLSCGCLRVNLNHYRSRTHGHSLRDGKDRARLSPEYIAWMGMKRRCRDPGRKYHGGRGIKVYERWLNSFEGFLAYTGRKPSPDHSLDRYPDPDGDYRPGNVRWATRSQQQNNRRSNRIIEFRGERKTVANWARYVGIKEVTLHDRIRRGWPLERALTEETLTPREAARFASQAAARMARARSVK
jgi:hypothetical protein